MLCAFSVYRVYSLYSINNIDSVYTISLVQNDPRVALEEKSEDF